MVIELNSYKHINGGLANTNKLYKTEGGLAKMGHRTELAHQHAPMLNSTQESTVICPTCNSKVTTVLTTPYGKVCSGCFKLIYIQPIKKAS